MAEDRAAGRQGIRAAAVPGALSRARGVITSYSIHYTKLYDGERRAVTEGVFTARAVRGLAAKTGIDMPIACAIAEVLFDGAEIGSTITNLLARPLRAERD